MANENNKTDYNLPRTNVFELLPEVYRSETNESVFENSINRFLTKSELEKVAGFIGEGNPRAIRSRQIPEPTPHRQAFQLQPLMYDKVGTIEHISSWVDIQNELSRLGVDIDLWPEWGNAQKFNWTPPIDFDKVIHFQDYFWVDNENSASRPQYITVRSPCTTARANLNFWQSLIQQFGATFTIVAVNPTESSISVDGDQTTLFVENFVFFIKNSTNVDLDSSFQQVVSSSFDDVLLRTVIIISDTFTDSTADGVISLEEELSAREAEVACRCFAGNTGGYDALPWDDNQIGTILWADDVLAAISWDTEAEWILENGPPAASVFKIWYDTSTDELKEFDGVSFVVVIQNFSLIIAQLTGVAFWDFTSESGCAEDTYVGLKQWQDQNKWVHRLDVTNFAKATPAAIPIIEYDANLELNEWTFNNYIWKYRTNEFEAFEDTTAQPSIMEIVPIDFWEDGSPIELIFDDRYGDLTSFLPPGTIIQTTVTSDVVEVVSSRFFSATPGEPYQTRVIINVPIGTGTALTLSPGSLTSPLAPGGGSFGTESATPLRPQRTSQGDAFRGYDVHWVRVGVTDTVPVNHQPNNPFREIAEDTTWTADVSGDFDYRLTYAAMEFIPTVTFTDYILRNDFLSGTTRSLRRRAVIGNQDARVYFDGIRQFGFFQELTDFDVTPFAVIAVVTGLGGSFTVSGDQTPNFHLGDPFKIEGSTGNDGDYTVFSSVYNLGPDETVITVEADEAIPDPTADGLIGVIGYVAGIRFNTGLEPSTLTRVRIGVGEGSSRDFGNCCLPLRVDEDNDDFLANGTQLGSVIEYRLNEQIKTNLNQYPLFDIYQCTGESAFEANQIFGYKTSPDAPVDPNVGLRIVVDAGNYSFDQFILGEDNSEIFAWRTLQNQTEDFWFNPLLEELKFWDPVGLTWSAKTDMTGHFREGIVSDVEPVAPERNIECMFWYDTFGDELLKRDITVPEWVVQPDVSVVTSDPTLQTIWRAGLNSEEYVPEYVDSNREPVPVGDPAGDWEIPDQLFFNHQHANRKCITSQELLTHFQTIIDAQPTIPAFSGPKSFAFHLIPSDEVNYGVGGTIMEFNDGFDTLLSSTFINNVTPPTLIEFAHDQYVSLQSTIQESYRANSVDLLTTTTDAAMLDLVDLIVNDIIFRHEVNDTAELVYGDSTTFTEVEGTSDELGIRNWIATLPYVKLTPPCEPLQLVDEALNVNQILHHDGHLDSFSFTTTEIEGITRRVIASPDPRTIVPPAVEPLDTFGRSTQSLPPNNLTEFDAAFNTTIQGRRGVYWYDVTTSPRVLYRLELVAAQVPLPSSSFPDGSLWMDTTSGSEVLRVKNGATWDVVAGLTIGDARLHNGTNPADVNTATVSAWQVFDLNAVIADIILEIENRLFENVPDPLTLNFDLDTLTDTLAEGVRYNNLLEQEFLRFVNRSDIVAPFSSVGHYNPLDPFTWNYKFSASGSRFEILDSDASSDTFTIQGDLTSVFILGFPFFVKNAGPNGGTHTTASSTYDGLNDRTIISVSTDVVIDSPLGILYTGLLASSENDGSESGGDFRDYYQKIYGTPYPHLEPWILQGYKNKPSWWDAQYSNEGDFADPLRYGDRRWKYSHGFNIIATDEIAEEFTIVGDFTVDLPPGLFFLVQGTPGLVNDGFWTVLTSTYNAGLNETTVAVVENIPSGVAGGRILIATGMWENIRIGVVPPGETYPNGVASVTGVPVIDRTVSGIRAPNLPTFNYFSVNIDNVTQTADGSLFFAPDDLLPPFWNFTAVYGAIPLPIDRPIRSLFFSFGTQIVTPGADYRFNDRGPVEWEWFTSAQYLYDQFKVAYQMQPQRFIHQSFNDFSEFITVNDLQMDNRLGNECNTFAHNRTTFHGEVIGDQAFVAESINQWYVNYNRFFDFDFSWADFRPLWVEWTAPLMYQFSSFIDTTSFEIAHRFFDLTQFDYNITKKDSKAVEVHFLDSFKITLLNIPPRIISRNNQDQWELEVTTASPLGRPFEYFPVHNYPFIINENNSVMKIYTYEIQGVSTFNDTFTVSGNQTDVFEPTTQLEIAESTSNDGTYTIRSSVYNPVADTTIIEVLELIPTGTADGVAVALIRVPPFETGDSVFLSTTGILPVPLEEQREFFYIKIDDRQFQLAATRDLADGGFFIPLLSTGRNEQFVGQLKGGFQATAGLVQRNDDFWLHYTLDDRETKTFVPPTTIHGIQTLINIIDGYEEITQRDGFVYNADSTLVDEDSGRLINWQLEEELFINFAFGAQVRRDRISDRYPCVVDDSTDVWTYTEFSPNFSTTEKVTVFSSGVYPTPIVRGLSYYVIRDSNTEFRLAATKIDAESGIAIDIIPTVGVGDLAIISAADRRLQRPTFEINPFRKAIWYQPDRGIISNVITGPTEDIRETNLIFDQFGRQLTNDNLRVFRLDKETKIEAADNIPNDISPFVLFPDIRNFLHIAGTQLFIDTFEHVVRFNNRTTEDALIYDPFLGLQAQKFEVLFERSPNFTQRPNVGGQYLSTFFNQGADLKRNIEAQIDDMRFYYDTYRIPENIVTTQHSRATIGYSDGVVEYLNDINVNAKSQFIFWRGMIQQKGSLNAVNAFVNSRRFIGAGVDEFWAFKIAEYGSPGEKEYPELYLTTRDARSNEVRLEFPRLPCIPGFENQLYEQEGCGYAFPDDGSIEPIAPAEETYTGILTSDLDRWFDQPDVAESFVGNGGSLYFDAKPRNHLDVALPNPAPETLVRHNFEDDYIMVTARAQIEMTTGIGDLPCPPSFTTPPIVCLTGLTGKIVDLGLDYIPLTNMLRVFKNGIPQTFITDWSEIIAGGLFATEIEFGTALVIGDVITVEYVAGVLQLGIHYENVNTNIVRFLFPELTDGTIPELTLWGFTAHKDALNPSKIIDKKAGVVTSNVEIWDPARGHHYSQAINIPITQNDEDQAIYTDTLLDQTIGAAPPVLVNPWNQEEVGLVWMDTSQQDYVSYYDTEIFPREDRIRLWGQLAGWSDIRMFKWVESDVPPAEWDALAAVEQGDLTIREDIRKSGVTKKNIFRRDRDNFEFTATAPTVAAVSVLLDPAVYGLTSLTDETGLINDSVQTFQATGGQTLFTLVNNYIIGAGMLAVTRNGGPVAFTETSTTSFTLTVPATVDDTVVATITSPDYEAEITIDGTLFNVIIRGSNAQTFSSLLEELRDDVPTATIELVNNNIVVTSPISGSSSDVTVDDTSAPASLDLFGQLINIDASYSPPESDLGVDSFLTFVTGGFAVGEEIRVSSTDTLPAPLQSEVVYEIDTVDVPAPGDFTIVGITIEDTGTGTHTASAAFFDDDAWVREETIFEEFDVLFEGVLTGPDTYEFTTTVFDEGDTVNVYINGLIDEEDVTVPAGGVIEVDDLREVDRVRFVRFGRSVLTPEELAFDPDVADDGTINTQFQQAFDFTQVDFVAPNGIDLQQRFYFWVEDVTTRDGKLLSPAEAKTQLITIPVAFQFFQKVRGPETVLFPDTGVVVDLPVRFIQVVVKGLRGLIDADRRFVIRFTRDFTLRSSLDQGDSALQLKNLHAEWQMLREKQQSVIPRELWDKITEAMIEVKLDDATIRVPSLERELFDLLFESESADTQYGLRAGQAFTDGPTAINTILTDLSNPDNFELFEPVDINTFFEQNSFDTPENITEAMDTIYTTFPFENTNRMFFEILHDALAFDSEQPDIFKTSWVALIGVQPFELEGAFDD